MTTAEIKFEFPWEDDSIETYASPIDAPAEARTDDLIVSTDAATDDETDDDCGIDGSRSLPQSPILIGVEYDDDSTCEPHTVDPNVCEYVFAPPSPGPSPPTPPSPEPYSDTVSPTYLEDEWDSLMRDLKKTTRVGRIIYDFSIAYSVTVNATICVTPTNDLIVNDCEIRNRIAGLATITSYTTTQITNVTPLDEAAQSGSPPVETGDESGSSDTEQPQAEYPPRAEQISIRGSRKRKRSYTSRRRTPIKIRRLRTKKGTRTADAPLQADAPAEQHTGNYRGEASAQGGLYEIEPIPPVPVCSLTMDCVIPRVFMAGTLAAQIQAIPTDLSPEQYASWQYRFLSRSDISLPYAGKLRKLMTGYFLPVIYAVGGEPVAAPRDLKRALYDTYDHVREFIGDVIPIPACVDVRLGVEYNRITRSTRKPSTFVDICDVIRVLMPPARTDTRVALMLDELRSIADTPRQPLSLLPKPAIDRRSRPA